MMHVQGSAYSPHTARLEGLSPVGITSRQPLPSRGSSLQVNMELPECWGRRLHGKLNGVVETWVERKGKGRKDVGPFPHTVSFDPHRSLSPGKKGVLVLML